MKTMCCVNKSDMRTVKGDKIDHSAFHASFSFVWIL